MIVAGVSNPALNGKIEALDKKLKGPLPSFCHVELGFAQLQLSFEHSKERFVIIPIGTMRNFNCETPKPENKDFFERFTELLRLLPKHRKLILMPIHADNHYTLLVVSESQVRWYEGLNTPKPSHQKAYKQILDIMELELPASRAHVSRQIGAECAFFTIHNAERELRKHLGEHEAVVGWPTQQRMVDLRVRISNWSAGLETERKRWEVEHNALVAKQKAQVDKWVSEAEERAKQKKLSEEAMADAKRLAEWIMHEGANPLEYPVPKSFQVFFAILRIWGKTLKN